MKPAIFIDRDGTLSEEVGYVNHPSRFHLFPFSAAAIKLINDNGWLAILTTNQSGVARGYFSEALVIDIHEQLKRDLENYDARLDAIYYCTHHPQVGEPPHRLDCDCRKPKTGLIQRAVADLDIDLQASWMIGDRYRDVETARNAKLHSALVLTGYGLGEWEYQRTSWQHQPDLISENVLQAVKSIVEANNARVETA